MLKTIDFFSFFLFSFFLFFYFILFILEVCWDGFWTLSFGLSQFHGHGSWLVCEVALSTNLTSGLDEIELASFISSTFWPGWPVAHAQHTRARKWVSCTFPPIWHHAK
jgi:hypothetical protein